MFNKLLLQWHQQFNTRTLPWKGIKDPYRIWLSEIILQQTRAEQGLPYYEKFIAKYPSIIDLAQASEQEVFQLWQGLGYYSRCRNLIHTAKVIAQQYHGVFPNTYEQIQQLKGVGPYTAAAIASFAFKLPYAVVDGNVVRILSRVFTIKDSFQTSKGKQLFYQKAQALIAVKKPDLYNQAIMDLGATICKPVNPVCDICPVQTICKAYLQNKISKFPTKKEKIILKQRHLHFFLPENQLDLFITKRLDKDIWHSLYTPLMVEMESENLRLQQIPFLKKMPIFITQNQQVLTHQKIRGYFYYFKSNDLKIKALNNTQQIQKSQINQFGFPRIIISFFEKYHYL